MSKSGVVSSAVSELKLGIRKSSRLVPILLMLLTIVLFVGYALPSGYQQLGVAFGLIKDVNQKLDIETVKKKLAEDGSVEKLWAHIQDKDWGFVDYVENIVQPVFKIFLEQLGRDFIEIVRTAATTLGQLALFSLIPGIAGLVYRRNFWAWFGSALAILLGINASGVFGKLTTADVMPWSGAIFFFIASQIVLLLLAFRLRRHVQSASFSLPPRVHNWGLAAILVVVGVSCWLGLGPGYSRNAEKASTPPAASTTVAPAETGAAQSSADQPAAAAEAAPGSSAGTIEIEIFGSSSSVQRSWIWSFLGDGLSGWFYRWEFILLGLPLIYVLLRNSSNWTAKRNKNIIICLDGTSNTPDQLERGFAAHTNVFRLFRMLKSDARGGQQAAGQFDASLCKTYKDRQIAFYYAGVGNKYDNDPLLQTIGMATGMGAGEIIERAYLDLVRVYQPGDRVFITGFSRGAAIARLLARTIDARGAPRWVWTLKLFGKHRTLWSSSRKDPVKIDVLGCFDTVGSFGVAKTIAGINFQQLNMFKDLTVPDNVVRAYHMVALDEERDSFEPTLMDPDPIRLERITEVWFTGDHANIGGGWATDSLSDVTLDFLLRRISSGYCTHEPIAGTTGGQSEPGDESWGVYLTAEKKDKAEIGERVVDDPNAVDPDPLGQARHWFSSLYKYRPRTLPLHAIISDTVFERMTKSLPIYAPQALFKLNDEIDKKRDLIDEKVNRLAETHSLNSTELAKVIEYKDKLRLRRWSEYWADVEALRGERLGRPEVLLDNQALDHPSKASKDQQPSMPLAAAPAATAA